MFDSFESNSNHIPGWFFLLWFLLGYLGWQFPFSTYKKHWYCWYSENYFKDEAMQVAMLVVLLISLAFGPISFLAGLSIALNVSPKADRFRYFCLYFRIPKERKGSKYDASVNNYWKGNAKPEVNMYKIEPWDTGEIFDKKLKLIQEYKKNHPEKNFVSFRSIEEYVPPKSRN